jgi:hypothetical protein
MIGNVRVARLVLPLLLTAGGLAAALAGCSGDDAGGSDGGGLSVSVTDPAADATVAVPFTVTVQASVPLGPEDSGKHHVHIWFDDNESEYRVVETPTTQITDLPSGPHIMHVSLRNANHSAAGAETQVALTVSGAPGAPTSAPAETSTPDGPPTYDY